MQFEQETRKLMLEYMAEHSLSPKKLEAEMGGALGWRWLHAYRADERGDYDIKKVQILYNYLTN